MNWLIAKYTHDDGEINIKEFVHRTNREDFEKKTEAPEYAAEDYGED
jgi:hypothetical protein